MFTCHLAFKMEKKRESKFSNSIFSTEASTGGTNAITSATCFYKGNHQQQVSFLGNFPGSQETQQHLQPEKISKQ